MHHKHRMSLAAVKNDAMDIRKRLLAKKQLLCTAAPAASAFGGSAFKPTDDAHNVPVPSPLQRPSPSPSTSPTAR